MSVVLFPDLPDAIEDPTTGVQVPTSDIDELAEAHDRIERSLRVLQAAAKLIRMAIARRASQEARTVRVRGERHRLRVEWPPMNWAQPVLKALWAAHPVLAPKYLRIDRLAPQAREIAKLRKESGPDEFMTFRERLLAAEEPSTAPPRVVLETATTTELEEQREDLESALFDSVEARR